MLIKKEDKTKSIIVSLQLSSAPGLSGHTMRIKYFPEQPTYKYERLRIIGLAR